MQARFHQVGAIQRAVDGHLPFVAAADGTDVATHSRTMPARLARLANRAFHNNHFIVT
jgi:hypothetical protein